MYQRTTFNNHDRRSPLTDSSLTLRSHPQAPTQNQDPQTSRGRRTPAHIRDTQTQTRHNFAERVTLTPPQSSWVSPLERYKQHKSVEPSPSPFRFAQQKLGIPEQQIKDNLAREMDELLQEIDQERRQALLEDLPIDRAFTKDDCLQFFSAIGIPPAGALRGVYCWATDRNYSEDALLITGENSNSLRFADHPG